jgi:hypothetical protein
MRRDRETERQRVGEREGEEVRMRTEEKKQQTTNRTDLVVFVAE